MPGTRSARAVARYVASPTRMPFDRRGTLEARRDVDEVRDDPLATVREHVGLDERLARVDADPDGELARRPHSRRARRWRRGSRAPPARRARGRPRAPTGTPKTAMTSSPMNFSTVPPRRSTCRRRTVWYGSSSRRTSSGSSRSARLVKPTRSAKSTVTCGAPRAKRRAPGRAARRRRRRSGSRPDSPGRSSGRRARSSA